MASDIDIASNALLLIGDEPISSFTEPGAGATAMANLYAETYKELLSEHPWTFAFKEQVLSQLSQSPDELTNFSYAYQLPTDYIRVWNLMPHSNYTIVGDKIYSNETRYLLRYIYKVAESQLPAHFVKAMEYKLASEAAVSVTEDIQKAGYYEAKYDKQLARAKNIDSQGRPSVAIVSSPFVDVR